MSGTAECKCGNEGETPEAIELKDCELCGESSCNECRHECDNERCHIVACEPCMLKFTSNEFSTLWFCNEDCRARTKSIGRALRRRP